MASHRARSTNARRKAYEAGVRWANDSASAVARENMFAVIEEFEDTSHKRCTRINCPVCVSNHLAARMRERLTELDVKPSNYLQDLTVAHRAAVEWIENSGSGQRVSGGLASKPASALSMVMAIGVAADNRDGVEVAEELGIRYADGHVIAFETIEEGDVMEGDTVVVRKHFSRRTPWRKQDVGD